MTTVFTESLDGANKTRSTGNNSNNIYDRRFAWNVSPLDIEKVFNNDYNSIVVTDEEFSNLTAFFNEASSIKFTSREQYDKFVIEAGRRHKCRCINKIKQYKVYRSLLLEDKIYHNSTLEKFMRLKAARSSSGVNVITIFTSGKLMGTEDIDVEDVQIKTGGCPMDCHYCPFEKDKDGNPTQPRSYLSTEPGNMRATDNKHHPVCQTYARLYQLELMGHISPTGDTPSKCEFIISGGTFNFYPSKYIDWFVSCMYYACNTYYDWRNWYKEGILYSLEKEKTINETTPIRIIGLTIETRPDYVTPINKKNPNEIDFSQLELFNRLGVTRVQIGIQHTDDTILKKVNRKCTDLDNQIGIRRLKQNGFKTDIHLMLDLPGSTPEMDKIMIERVVYDPNYQAHQWKIYPTEVTPFTRIKKWHQEGLYKPYAEDHSQGLSYLMVDVISHAMGMVPRYIRVNRVVRDIPHKSIDGGLKCSNMRQLVDNKMNEKGLITKCIRTREVKLKNYDVNNIKLTITEYESSSGREFFIEYNSKDTSDTLYGFCRLRLNKEWYDVLPFLYGCALIQELHVYGLHTNVGTNDNDNTQHKGLGTSLLKKAEEIAFKNEYKKIAVISGVGVRGFYKKRGYTLDNNRMIKKLERGQFISFVIEDSLVLSLLVIIFVWFLNYIIV